MGWDGKTTKVIEQERRESMTFTPANLVKQGRPGIKVLRRDYAKRTRQARIAELKAR